MNSDDRLVIPAGTITGNPHESFGGVRAPIGHMPYVDRPGQARIVRRVRFPDSDTAQDRRLHIHLDDLKALVALAERSPMQRVVFHGVCVDVEVRVVDQGPDVGHQFENWSLLGQAMPEGMEAELRAQRHLGQIKNALDTRS